MPDFPALPSYLTGDGSAPAPPSQPTGLPLLPSYLRGPQPPPAQTASASTSQDPNADQLMQLAKAHGRPVAADQGRPMDLAPMRPKGSAGPRVQPEAPPDAGWWTAAKGAASKAFGAPLAGGAEMARDLAEQHPILANLLLGPAGKEAALQVPQGLTHELGSLAEQQRQAFLAAHPGTGGAAAEYATELGVNLLPLVAGSLPAIRAMATTANPTVASALRGAAVGGPIGAAIGAPMGYAASYGAPTGDRLRAAGETGLFMGGLGALGGLAARPPTLPSYLTGEHPLPDGGAFRLPREAPQEVPGATISPGGGPTPTPAEVAPQGGVQGMVRVDAARSGLGDETVAAMQQAAHQALNRAAPGRAALHDDGSVTLAADNEAHLHDTMAQAQQELAARPLAATLPDGSVVHIPIRVTYGLQDLPAATDALANRVLPAEAAAATAGGARPGGGAGAGGAPGLALPGGDELPRPRLAEAPGDAWVAQAGGVPLPGQALGQAAAGAAELQAAGHGAQGTGAAGAEAAQLEGRPGAEGPAAPGAEAAAPPPHGGGPAGQALAQLQSGEAGFVKNPMAPTPAERGWRQYYPMRRSFVWQENADRLAAQLHETDLMKQFPDPNLRRAMSLAVERNDPMQAPAEQFVREHPQGGEAALAEIERQRQQGRLNMKGLRDLGFVPKDTPDVQDYIRHQWDPVPGAPQKPYAPGRAYESPLTSVLQEREFPTLGTGIRAGRTPTTLDYATMVRNGDQEFSHTLALHRLMQDVSEIRFMGDGKPAYLRATSKDPAYLQALGQDGYKDVSGIPLLNRAIPGEGTLHMHGNLWDNLSPILRDSPSTPIGRAMDTALGTAKQMLLGFSFFHPAELTIQNALQRGVTPALWEGLKRGFGVPGLNQLTQRMGWGNLERETWMQAAKEGVNYTSPETDTNMIQAQKTLAGLARRMGATEDTAAGKVVGVAGKVLASPHEAMFPGYMAPLKVTVQTINRDKLLRLRNGDDFAMGALGYLNRNKIRALSDDDAIAGVTNNTNNAFGGQSTRLFVNRLASDPMAQKVLSRMFLAPDWFTSGSKLMAEPLSPNPVTRTLGMQMYGRLALQTFVGLNLANYALTRAFSPTGRGHFMIDNEPGKETQLQIAPNEYMNVMKLQRELPDTVGKERVSNAIGAFAHAGPQGAALEWLRQPRGPWPGADEPVATSHFRATDPSWRETPVLSTIGNKVNPLPNAAFGELSGHYLSGYPTDLTKAQEKAQQRGTTEMPQTEAQYRLHTAARPFMPIPGSKLADTDQPLTGGEVAKQLMVPFQLSKGLSSYTAVPQLADAFRRGDQQTVSEITAILRSHIDPRDPKAAALGEMKLQKTLAFARAQAHRYPAPLTASGKPEAPAGTPWLSPP